MLFAKFLTTPFYTEQKGCKKGVPYNFQENTCVRVSFFNKAAGLGNVTLLKKDSDTGIFLRILLSFSKLCKPNTEIS